MVSSTSKHIHTFRKKQCIQCIQGSICFLKVFSRKMFFFILLFYEAFLVNLTPDNLTPDNNNCGYFIKWWRHFIKGWFNGDREHLNITFEECKQKQPPEVFYKKGVLRNFPKFTGNHLCQRHSFLINFIKKESLPQVLSCEFSEISKNTFFIEHLGWLLLYKVIYHHGTSNYIAKGDFDGVQVILLQVNI